MDHVSPPSAAKLLARSMWLLVRPPYITLLVVVLFVSFVSGRVGYEDGVGATATLLLWVLLSYLHIAVILAAAAGAPNDIPIALVADKGRPTAADPWLRAAFGRRCFLRYFATDLVTLLLVAVALGLFVLPGFIVGGVVALAPIAAVLEYRGPGGALRRSLELTRPARRTIGAVFGLCVLLPNIAAIAYFLIAGDDVRESVRIALGLFIALMSLIATIALTNGFLALGGGITPRSAKPTAGVSG